MRGRDQMIADGRYAMVQKHNNSNTTNYRSKFIFFRYFIYINVHDYILIESRQYNMVVEYFGSIAASNKPNALGVAFSNITGHIWWLQHIYIYIGFKFARLQAKAYEK